MSDEPEVFNVTNTPEGETHRLYVWPDGRVQITIEKDGDITVLDATTEEP